MQTASQQAIDVGRGGRVLRFEMNDRCAAGTGRFLEVMARALEVPLDDLGSLARASLNPCPISSLCTVFAESEVVFLRGEGRAREDIAAGIHGAIASRVAAMLSQMGLEEAVVLTGGVARNSGVVRALCDELQLAVQVPERPQLTGALGAALIAAELSG